MRAVWWRELRELFVPALAVWLLMAVFGSELPRRGLRHETMLLIAVVGGGFGLFQGLLDRHRRHDGFLLHRPIGALGIHGARSLAGATVIAVGALSASVSGLVDVWLYERRAARSREFYARMRIMWSEQPHDWGTTSGDYGAIVVDFWGALLGTALLFGGWAVIRFAVSLRRVSSGVVVAGALAVGGWSLIARCPTVSLAALTATGIVAVVATLSFLDLAGGRR